MVRRADRSGHPAAGSRRPDAPAPSATQLTEPRDDELAPSAKIPLVAPDAMDLETSGRERDALGRFTSVTQRTNATARASQTRARAQRTPTTHARPPRPRDARGRFVRVQSDGRTPRMRDDGGRFVRTAPDADLHGAAETAQADDKAAVADTVAHRERDGRGRFVRRPSTPAKKSPERDQPKREWTLLKVRDRRRLVKFTPNKPGFKMTRRRERILESEISRLRKWIVDSNNEYVVVHSGTAPTPAHIEQLIDATEGGVHRGGDAANPGVLERPAICIDDDGSNPLVSRTWHHLVQEGAHAVTVGSQRPGNTTTNQAAPVRSADAGPTFVVRTTDVDVDERMAPKKAYRRPTWWLATLVVTVFFALQVARIATDTTLVTRGGPSLEDRWIDAARQGNVSDPNSVPLPGSSLWPALARPVIEAFGVAGVRWLSLLFAVVAIVTSSSAGSRLFGRWAARSTAITLTIGLMGSGVATSATPVPLSMAALGVSLLGIALVEGHDRRSWILLAGLAATVAVLASYESLVFVLVLSWFFTMLRGRRGFTNSNTYGLVLLAGLLAWFLPTREASVRFIAAPRAAIDWNSLFSSTVWLCAVVLVVSLLIAWGVTHLKTRIRILVLSTSLLAVPFASLLSGNTTDQSLIVSMAMVLVAPAVGGAIAYKIAKWRFGFDVIPTVRSAPELLTVDPSSGRIHNRLVRYANRQVRMAAATVVLASLWYLPWAFLNVEWRNWWIAIPFLLANSFMVGSALLSAFNNWNRAIPIPVDVARGHEPLVGVIVPTYSEPLHMVLNTVRSILDQDWPVERLRIVVSDDAHSDQVKTAFATLAASLPDGVLLYNRPPKRGDPARRGDSKSGNLNSAIMLVDDCDFVETRDADDLVGSTNFLRATVSQLMDDPGLGFIQTIKETKTSPGDPFNNNEPFFYRGTMLARNSDYAIFPCGSGLVWRRAALKEIDDFPVWNLVEDLHSGVLGLRAGWRGLYVPIVGAYAQHSPEDIANVFKQRGTWALDTTRILVFDRFRGIPNKMRLHFLEQALFYLLSFPLLVLIAVPGFGLFFDRFPLDTDPTTYAIHFWGFALAIELILLALAADQEPGSLWRSRLSWVGMAPIYAKAAIRAVWFGPRRKPVYKVTRKTDEYQVYIKMVKVHWLLIVGTVTGVLVAFYRDNFLTELDLGSLYWGVVAMVGLAAFLRLSWFGVDLKQRLDERFRDPIDYWVPILSPLVLPIVHLVRPPAIDTRSLVAATTVHLRTLISLNVESEPSVAYSRRHDDPRV